MRMNDDRTRSGETAASPADVHAATVPKHTPGPWREGPTEGIGQRGRLIVVDAAGQRIADCEADKAEGGLTFVRPLREDTANARLIAAAPDLYNAGTQLKSAVSALVLSIVVGTPLGDVEQRVNDATDAMNAALRKAEGH